MTADEWRHQERCVGYESTEEVWLACTAADYLLLHAENIRLGRGQSELSERKLRLFGCACCRLLWSHIPAAASRSAVELAESYANGNLGVDELVTACDAAEGCRLPRDGGRVPRVGERERDEYVKVAPARAAASIARADDGWPFRTHIGDIIEAVLEATEFQPFGYDREEVEATLCDLFRDIFGNPFRPVVFATAWRTATVVALGARMYETRDFTAMPILADALQDAGCGNDDILTHCRASQQVHVRGCWVMDLILNKT